MNDNASIQC